MSGWRAPARGRLVVTLLGAASLSATPLLGQETDPVSLDSGVETSTLADTLPSAADRARSMVDTLRATADSVQALQATRLTDPDVDLDFLRVLFLEQVGQTHRTLRGLVELLDRSSPDSLPADSVRGFLSGYLDTHLDLIDQLFEATIQDFDELRLRRSSATAQEAGPLEASIRNVRANGDTLIQYEGWALSAADSLHLDMTDRWASYDQLLHNFAENALGRLQVAAAERDEIEKQIRVTERTDGPESGIADLRLRSAATEMRIQAIAGSITSVTQLLEQRGFETAAYQEALIRTTGEVTSDVLDPAVLVRLVRSQAADAWQYLRHNAGTAFVRVLIVVAFTVFFRIFLAVLWRLALALRLVRGSHLSRDLVGRLVRPVAMLIGFYVGLSVIGVQTTTLLAGLGVAGVVVGFALQDSLSNFFAGIAILASRAFDVDDQVEVAGEVGIIRAMGLWNTTIVTFDSRRLLIPNRNIWGAKVENRSVEPNRRADCVTRIGYETDLQEAIVVLEQLLRDDPRVLEDPAPSVWVSRLDESWAEVKLWPWARTEDWWSLYSDLPRMVRLKFAEEGIDVSVWRYVKIRNAETHAGGSPEGDRAILE